MSFKVDFSKGLMDSILKRDLYARGRVALLSVVCLFVLAFISFNPVTAQADPNNAQACFNCHSTVLDGTQQMWVAVNGTEISAHLRLV